MTERTLDRNSLLGLFTMLIFAITVMGRASIQTSMGITMGLDTQARALILLLEIFGFATVTFLGDRILRHVSVRRFALASGLISVAGLGCMSLAFWLRDDGAMALVIYCLGMLMLGFGVGSYQLLANSLAVHPNPIVQRRRFNLVHTLFGVGAVMVLHAAGALFTVDSDWWWILWVVTVPSWLWLLVVVPLLKSLPTTPADSSREPEPAKVQEPWALRFGVLAIATYVAADTTLINFTTDFLRDEKGFDQTSSLLLLSSWFAALALGRLTAAWIAKLMRPFVLPLLLIAGNLCLLLFVQAEGAMLYILALNGFLVGPLFPQFVALARRDSRGPAVRVVGVMVGGSAIGGAIGVTTAGFIAKNLDTTGVVLVVFGFFTLSFVASVLQVLKHYRLKRQSTMTSAMGAPT